MSHLKQINILDMLELHGERECQAILSTFISPLNKDVEAFLHNKAINFARQHIAMTFLVFTEHNNQLFLVGYYTLSNKFVSVSGNALSQTMRKRINRFSQYDSQTNQYLLPLPLIAQLGKNFAYINSKLSFNGSHLLTLACNKITQAQSIIGGKMTYIECVPNPKLYYFYTSNNFHIFGQRQATTSQFPNSHTLIQMIKYLT